MAVNANPCGRPNVEICRCVGFVLKAVPSLVALQQFRYVLSTLFRLNTEVQSGELDWQNSRLWHIKSTKYHECRYCARTTSTLCESQFQRFRITQAVPLLPVYPLPVVDFAASKTNPSIIHNPPQQPTTRRANAIKSDLRPHRERKHHPFLRSRGVRRGRRGKGRLAEVEVGEGRSHKIQETHKLAPLGLRRGHVCVPWVRLACLG